MQGAGAAHNGLAYAARLAFTDIGVGDSDNMITPRDLVRAAH